MTVILPVKMYQSFEFDMRLTAAECLPLSPLLDCCQLLLCDLCYSLAADL